MTMATLPPMQPGGKWLSISGNQEPHYVVHEAHIKRLLSEGAQVVADPRDPAKIVQPQPSETEATLRAELDALKVQMQALVAAQHQVPIGATKAAKDTK